MITNCMLAQEVEKDNYSLNALLEDGNQWVMEEKFDGTRALIKSDGENVIIERRLKDMKERLTNFYYTDKFPEVIREVKKLGIIAELDCEIVCPDEPFNVVQKRCATDFSRTQNEWVNAERMKKLIEYQEKYPVKFMVFDILSLNGEDMKNMPFTDRKAKLKELLSPRTDYLEYIPYTNEGKKAFLEKIKSEEKEGVMFKVKTSTYRFKRSSSWVKWKNWKFSIVEFNGYERNSAGITLTNDEGIRVQCAGDKHLPVRKVLDTKGHAKIRIRHLGGLTEKMRYRKITYKEMMK